MTLKRVRVYATLIAAALWTVLVVDYTAPGDLDRVGKVKGTDFIQVYAAGSLVRDGRPDLLYDVQAYHARQVALVPAAKDVVYIPVQSPQLALFFAPLSRLTYRNAVYVWFAIAGLIYAALCRALFRAFPALSEYRYETAACCAAFPAWYSTIVHGQTSILGAAAVVVALLALSRGRRLEAGAAFGVLAFKPHWALAACAVLAAAREWRTVAGLIASAALQVALTAAIVGVPAMTAYFSLMRSIGRFGELLEPRAGYSLRSFFSTFVPYDGAAWGLYAAAALMTLIGVARIWRSGAPFALRAAAVPVAIVLISPHVFEYDLILLAPTYILLAAWIAECHRRAGSSAEAERARQRARYVSWALVPLFIAPILTALPAAIRLQFAVPPMATLMVLLWVETEGKRDPVARLKPSRSDEAVATG